MKVFRGRTIPESYEELCFMWEEYYNKNGVYPNSLICQKDFNLPAWSRVTQICGNKFEEFCMNFNINKINVKKDYEYYCKLFVEVSNNLGRTLTNTDLLKNEYGIPNPRWLVKYCPDEKVKNYDDFINYLGLKPYYSVSKEYATKQILLKYDTLNGKMKRKDFKNPIGDEIGIGTIRNIWGTFNNMLKDLGLPINQEGMIYKQRPLEELKNDISKLCEYIFETDGRKNISRDDVKNCEWCLDPQVYDRWFKRELGMNLSGYIEYIGFVPNKAGMGMVHTFEDGEVVKSKFEFDVSVHLRDSKIKYQRNLEYKKFCNNYYGNKDCDYVININDKTWYIEIAGMLDYRKISKSYDDDIRKRYKKGLKKKVSLLEENNLNYKIIYPVDFQNKSLDEIFYFLNT